LPSTDRQIRQPGDAAAETAASSPAIETCAVSGAIRPVLARRLLYNPSRNCPLAFWNRTRFPREPQGRLLDWGERLKLLAAPTSLLPGISRGSFFFGRKCRRGQRGRRGRCGNSLSTSSTPLTFLTLSDPGPYSSAGNRNSTEDRDGSTCGPRKNPCSGVRGTARISPYGEAGASS